MTPIKRTLARPKKAPAEAPDHSVVYDTRLKKVYFLTDPRATSVELKAFVAELNEKQPTVARYQLATVARTRHYSRDSYSRHHKPGSLEQQFDEYVAEHPEFRLELAWTFYRSEFYFGYPRTGDPERDSVFGLRGSVHSFANRAYVEKDVARLFVRGKLIELAGEDFVNLVAPELSVPIPPDKPEEALSA